MRHLAMRFLASALASLLFFMGAGSVFAAGTSLEVRVHRNSLDGPLYTWDWLSTREPDGSLSSPKLPGSQACGKQIWVGFAGGVNFSPLTPADFPNVDTTAELVRNRLLTLTGADATSVAVAWGSGAEATELAGRFALPSAGGFLRTTNETLSGATIEARLTGCDGVTIPVQFDAEKSLLSGSLEIQGGRKNVIDLVLTDASGATIVSGAQTMLKTDSGSGLSDSSLITFAAKFAARAANAFDWALQISDTGVSSPAIGAAFGKVVMIVNGFFILALLGIALAWNFSILIPKSALKRMVVMFVVASLLVNFSLPIHRMLISGSGFIEQVFLQKSDGSHLTSADFSGFSGEVASHFVGKRVAPSNETKLSLRMDTAISGSGSALIPYVPENGIANAPLGFAATVSGGTISGTSAPSESADSELEPAVTVSALLLAMSSAHLLIAILFVLRNVMLWFLLVTSPVVLLFMIAKSTRSLLAIWGMTYFRWLLIGPFLALFLSITANIWAISGVPIESSAIPVVSDLSITNLVLTAPGSQISVLASSAELMKYIAAILMLLFSAILPFWLTGGKAISALFDAAISVSTSKVAQHWPLPHLFSEPLVAADHTSGHTGQKENGFSPLKNNGSEMALHSFEGLSSQLQHEEMKASPHTPPIDIRTSSVSVQMGKGALVSENVAGARDERGVESLVSSSSSVAEASQNGVGEVHISASVSAENASQGVNSPALGNAIAVPVSHEESETMHQATPVSVTIKNPSEQQEQEDASNKPQTPEKAPVDIPLDQNAIDAVASAESEILERKVIEESSQN